MSDLSALMPCILLTLQIAGCATLLATIFAVGLAWLTARYTFRGQVLLDSVLRLPLVLPPTVLGYYLLVLLGRHGWLGQLLDGWGIRLIFSWQGAVIASAIVAFPLIYSGVKAALLAVPVASVDAARLLGLSAPKVFSRIELPLARNGIVAAILLGFARALGEFGATFMVAGSLPGQTQTLSVAIYEAVQAGQNYQAQMMVFLLTTVGLSIMLATSRLGRPEQGWRV